MRRLIPALVCVLLLAACKTKPGSAPAGPAYSLSAQPVIGRILVTDTRHGTAVVALNLEGTGLPRVDNWQFISRRDDLTPTARLAGTVHRSGSTLGVIIIEGDPQPGDEVTLAPSVETAP